MAKPKKRRCVDCRRKEPPQGHNICQTCEKRRYRAKNPIQASLTNLQQNCKRRKKEAIKRGLSEALAETRYACTLTIEEFTEFCYRSDYIAGKGRTVESYSIDRVNPERGYHIDNIQRLTVSENSRKGKKLNYDYLTGFATVTPAAPVDASQNVI